MKSVMTPQQQFARVASPNVKRSTFDRSHGLKTAFDFGDLIPCFLDEALPGDTHNLSTTIFGRLATPLKPLMDNMFVDVHYFSCPLRLLFDNFTKMHGEQDDPGDSIDFTMPTLTSTAGTGYLEGSIFDYIGLPTKVAGYEHRVDPLLMYNKIWNEWYRDENLQNSLTVNTTGTGLSSSDFSIQKRGKRKDYFTSALPWAQKATAVTIPLGTSAPVTGIGTTVQSFDDTGLTVYVTGNSSSETWTGIGGKYSHSSPNDTFVMQEDPNNTGYPNIRADLSAATAATVNQWRQAFQIQSIYEIDARGGTRYIEQMKAHFGVTSLDARLQRSEYLGGISTRINVNPIANTSEDATNKQGDLTGIGTFGKSGKGFIKSFTEHELVLGIISARADLNYQQGLERMWSRSTRFDFYYPSLAQIGEQAVLNSEIYIQGTTADDDVFGYQENFSDYKYKQSKVTGVFRSNHSASLDVWHLSQEFGSLPSLDSTFVQEAPPISRVVANTTQPELLVDMYFNLKSTRPMPVFNTPVSLMGL